MKRTLLTGYDELLLLVIGVAGIGLIALFASMSALRPYYTMLMPAVITGGTFLAWALLRAARLRRAGEQTAPDHSTDEAAAVEHEAEPGSEAR